MPSIAEIHADWVKSHINSVKDEFSPDDYPAYSDYNQHNVDLDADGEALDEFFTAVREKTLTAAAQKPKTKNVIANNPDIPQYSPHLLKSVGKIAKSGSGLSTIGNHHWDEGEHPRSGKTGEFINKGTSELGAVAAIAKKFKAVAPTTAIYKTKYSAGQVVAEQPKQPGKLQQRLTWDGKNFKTEKYVNGKWETDQYYNKGDAYKKLQSDKNWGVPGSVALAEAIAPAAPAVGKNPPSPAAVASMPIQQMSPAEFDNWFKNIDKNLWDSLATPDQNKIGSVAHWVKSQGYPNASNTIENWTASNPLYGKDLQDVNFEALSEQQFYDAVNGMEGGQWASLSTAKKNEIVTTDFKWSGKGNGKSAVTAKLDEFIQQWGMGNESDVSHNLIEPDLANLFSNMGSDDVTTWFEDNLTPAYWTASSDTNKDTLTSEADYQYEQLGNILPQTYLNNVKEGKSLNAPEVTAPAPKAAPASLGEKIHNELQSEMVPVYDLGHPKTNQPAGSFSVLGDHGALMMQDDMLGNTGKTSWTSSDKAAVQRYTNKIGYQTVNALLRNDHERMKMFTDQQLLDGKKNAIDLQQMMLPTTQNAQLFRGTGAHAFGFSSNSVSTHDLKKLEGKSFTDQGFVSTQVVNQTDVGFQYTQKPIKVIIDAPEGTPGVFVSHVTPGWSAESEFILAAGSQFKIKEVREATTTDKSKWGSQLEQVVHMEVVPHTNAPIAKNVLVGKTPKPVKTVAAPPVKIPDAKILLKVKAVPFKFNTVSVHSVKYTDGQVVAEKFGNGTDEGPDLRIVWKNSSKQFLLQKRFPSQGPHANWINAVDEAQKGNAFYWNKTNMYKAFKDDKSWFEPGALPSSTLVDQSGGSSPSAPGNAPKISGIKAADFSADVLQKQDSGTILFSPMFMKKIYSDFTNKGFNLKWPPHIIFEHITAKQPSYESELKTKYTGVNIGVSLLQIIATIDQEAADKAGTPNAHLLEKKIVEWLQTPNGKKQAPKILAQAHENAKFYVPSAADISKPETGKKNPEQFRKITDSFAAKMQDSTSVTITAEQQHAIHDYTGSAYDTLNGQLREGTLSDYTAAKANLIQGSMWASPEDIQLFRGIKTFPINGKNLPTLEDLQALTGSVFHDKGFSSTSIEFSGTFTGARYHLKIRAPKGTPMLYARPFSAFPQESEMILAAGTKFKILGAVESKSNVGFIDVDLEIVP